MYRGELVLHIDRLHFVISKHQDKQLKTQETERALILEKMKLGSTRNMAAYRRKIAVDGDIIQIGHSDIKAMTAEIQKIGVNVNQIARRVNSTGSV